MITPEVLKKNWRMWFSIDALATANFLDCVQGDLYCNTEVATVLWVGGHRGWWSASLRFFDGKGGELVIPVRSKNTTCPKEFMLLLRDCMQHAMDNFDHLVDTHAGMCLITLTPTKPKSEPKIRFKVGKHIILQMEPEHGG